LQPSQFTKLWGEIQHIQNKVAKERIKKRVTQEKSPPRVIAYTHGVNANGLKETRHYESRKRQHVGNPVTKRAVRLHSVSDIETFGGSTCKYKTPNDSCGNPQKKALVVS
jgi:hypothetical protein